MGQNSSKIYLYRAFFFWILIFRSRYPIACDNRNHSKKNLTNQIWKPRSTTTDYIDLNRERPAEPSRTVFSCVHQNTFKNWHFNIYKVKFTRYRYHTSLEGTFKLSRNAGFSNFWSKTPKQGNPTYCLRTLSTTSKDYSYAQKTECYNTYLLSNTYSIFAQVESTYKQV